MRGREMGLPRARALGEVQAGLGCGGGAACGGWRKEAAAHAHSARHSVLPFSRPPLREERLEARAWRLAAISSLSLLLFEDDEAGHHFFLLLARLAVLWDPLLL